jgi:hypothetical protein
MTQSATPDNGELAAADVWSVVSDAYRARYTLRFLRSSLSNWAEPVPGIVDCDDWSIYG